eukprot:CAMPEP_0179021342 /NCGR_PEP_ID=MMETSP0796-20121207/5838_1 /TAXON_ID=73915 /ORGANISM="Pyrodinium bahamense, Strain pbaha01" /LENGTH=338 /DNA_ID=CAMNT_0020717165 /DNA_START=92 /DNA_END=1108 /DNA_ORIENTATION=-
MASTGATGAAPSLQDPLLLGQVLAACHEGDFVLADELLSSALSSLGTEACSSGLSGVEQAQALVVMCAAAGEARLAAVWLERLHTAGLRPGAETLFVVLNALVVKDLAGDAEELFVRARAAGVEADEGSYSTLIAACGRTDVERAEAWFDRMGAAGIRAGPASFSAVLQACAAARDRRRAERWLARMDAFGVPPDVACYAAVIEACAAAACAERAEMWLRHVTGGKVGNLGFAPARHCYIAAAQAYAAEGGYVDAERLFAEMEEWGIGLDEHSMSVLLSAYKCAGPGRGRAERAFRGYAARGLPVAEPLLRELRAAVGGRCFGELLAEGLLGPAPAVA